MPHPSQPRRLSVLLPALALLVGLMATEPARAQVASSGPGFVPGARTLYALDLASVPVGEWPKGLKLLKGNVTVVEKDGEKMLRASDPAELLVPLGEILPEDFTIEIDLVPKTCCNPSDLAFEGTASSNRGPASMQVEWNPSHFMVVGGGETTQSDMPEDLKAAIPSMLTEVRASFDRGAFKLYTNGKKLVTLANRKFVHTRSLWVALGGQDDDKHAVYVSRIRVATNSPKPQ
jgi:hypothetical protein